MRVGEKKILRPVVERVGAGDAGRTRQCAALMAASEPWLTLRVAIAALLGVVRDAAKEVHAVVENGRVVACIVLDMRGPFAGYIQAVCVHPGQRGRGLGTALVRWAEKRVFRETPNVFLCVSSFNKGAQRFYRRLGYQTVGRLRDFIVAEHDEVLLRKTIGPRRGFRKKKDPAKLDRRLS